MVANAFCKTNNSQHGGSCINVQKDIVNILRIMYFANFHQHLRYGKLFSGGDGESKQIFKLQKKVVLINQQCRKIYFQQGIV